jgi:hypothetical protein
MAHHMNTLAPWAELLPGFTYPLVNLFARA